MIDIAVLKRVGETFGHAEHRRLIADAADEIEGLRKALRNVRGYIKDCDHEPALDEIDTVLS